MRNILIIEDDKILNKGVAFALKKEGYNVISAYTKQEGKTAVDIMKLIFYYWILPYQMVAGLIYVKK